MKRSVIISLMLILCATISMAQNEIEALRYSRTFFGGTARAESMGGAFGALGGDFSVFSTNPAGIAIFRKTELTVTPAFYSNTISSEFLIDGTTAEDKISNMAFNNFGAVGTFKSGKEEGWVNVNFGVAYNRTNNFNRNLIIEGHNNNTSIVDVWMDNAQGQNPDDLWAYRERLAFDTWLIDTVGTQNEYVNAVPQLGQLQRKVINSKGSMGEFDFTFGANYDNKVYIGASFGIISINYSEESIYREIDDLNIIYDFKSLSYEETLKTIGTGFNFKLGMIVKPMYWLRIGGAIHTPTFLAISDEYDTYMRSSFDLYDDQGNSSYKSEPTDIDGEPIGPFTYDYELTSPFKAIGSLGFVIKQNALVCLEYEFVDYTNARLASKEGDYDFYNENDAIRSNYKGVGNIRAGAEVKIDAFSLRAGIGYYPSPYANTDERLPSASMRYSGGFGLNTGPFFLDFAYTYSDTDYTMFFYDVYENQDLVGGDLFIKESKFIVTLGFRF